MAILFPIQCELASQYLCWNALSLPTNVSSCNLSRQSNSLCLVLMIEWFSLRNYFVRLVLNKFLKPRIAELLLKREGRMLKTPFPFKNPCIMSIYSFLGVAFVQWLSDSCATDQTPLLRNAGLGYARLG